MSDEAGAALHQPPTGADDEVCDYIPTAEDRGLAPCMRCGEEAADLDFAGCEHCRDEAAAALHPPREGAEGGKSMLYCANLTDPQVGHRCDRASIQGGHSGPCTSELSRLQAREERYREALERIVEIAAHFARAEEESDAMLNIAKAALSEEAENG